MADPERSRIHFVGGETVDVNAPPNVVAAAIAQAEEQDAIAPFRSGSKDQAVFVRPAAVAFIIEAPGGSASFSKM